MPRPQLRFRALRPAGLCCYIAAMIVYLIRRSSEVAQLLERGLVRADGRQYLFARWQDAALLLNGLYRASGGEHDPHVALVIDADEDMLVRAPIPERRLPAGLRSDDTLQLQAHSYYAEVDVSAHRIRDVKNGFGDSVRARFENASKPRTPIWRFLAYAKPYWRYVVAATVCGLLKFLAPLAFPWMLKELLDGVVLNAQLDPDSREREILYLIGGVLAINVVWMIATYYRSVFAAIAGHRLIRDLRIALFSHVQRLSHDFFTRHQTGAIASRVVNDISLAQNFVGSALTNVWMDAVLLVALVCILVSIHPMITLVGAFAGVRYFGLLGVLLGPLAIVYFLELVRLYRKDYIEPQIVVAPAPVAGGAAITATTTVNPAEGG